MMFKHVVFVICAVLFADNGAAEEPRTRTVAFFANIKESRDYATNDIVKFDNVVTNEGNAYNKDTGVFTAIKSGLYVFYFNTLSNLGSRFLLHLMRNNEILTSISQTPWGQAGNSAVVRLKSGDQVYVKANGASKIYNDSGRPYATFSGYSLREYKSS